MTEITVPLCEAFKAIGIDISEADLRKFEQALYERGLNVAPRAGAVEWSGMTPEQDYRERW